jgi:PAS domain S-box-containing protein
MLLYALLFLPLYSLLGPMVAALAILPVAAVGWLLGMLAGVLAGLLSFPLHILLLSLVGETWRLTTNTGLAGSLVIVIIGAMVGLLHDQGEQIKEELTERKRTEEKLRREMELNNIFIQASPAFFVAIGSDGKTMMMNDAMLHTLGYTIDEVAGRDYLMTFVPEGDRTMLSRVFAELTKSHQPTHNENRVLTRDGRELLVEWHGRPVFNENGEFDFFFGLGIDITERKRAEEELQKRFKELEIYYRATIGRESRIIELKDQVNELLERLGEKKKYLGNG